MTTVNALLEAQDRTQQRLDAVIVQIQSCCERVDAFIAEVQQDSTHHSERIAKLEGITERLEGIRVYLVHQDDRQRG